LLDEMAKQADSDEENPPAKRQKLVQTGTDYQFLCSHLTSEPSEAQANVETVNQALLQLCFDAASRSDTKDTNRRKLYKIWRERMQTEDATQELDGL
jgi:ribosomal RNA-processing protein 1